MLDVPKSTIYREIREGRLIARRVGKFYRVHADRFDEYLKGPDPVSQPDYMNVQIPVSGLSATGEKIQEPDFAAQARARRQKRRSRDI